LPSTGSAVDLGCGSGVQTLLLAEHGLDVVGVDISEIAIERAKGRAAGHPAEARVRFLAGDVTQLRGIGEPFDVLFDRGCYHMARRQNLDRFLNSLEELSRPGSVFFVLAFNSNEPPPEFPDLPLVSEQELRDEFGRAFEVTDLRACRLDRPRGFQREPLFWSVLLTRRGGQDVR
jgi:SAM-dependent methyltransferase